MDFVSTITSIAEKGWRIGLPLALCAAVAWLAHRYHVPEPGVLAPYLGVVTIAGLLGAAITLVALVSATGSWIAARLRAKGYASQEQINQQKRIAELRREMFARMEILEPFQKSKLVELLENHKGPMFVMDDGDGPAMSLVSTGLILSGERAHRGYVTYFNPLLEYERAEAIKRLKTSLGK